MPCVCLSLLSMHKSSFDFTIKLNSSFTIRPKCWHEAWPLGSLREDSDTFDAAVVRAKRHPYRKMFGVLARCGLSMAAFCGTIMHMMVPSEMTSPASSRAHTFQNSLR